MSFTKMDSGIINSSLWDEPAYVFKLFATFWAKCDNSDGVVTATKEAIYRASNISRDEFDEAIITLTSPDELSTSTMFEGKRILQESANKWLIVNYKKYRGEKEYSDKPEAVRKKVYRDTLKEKEDLGQCPVLGGHTASVSDSDSVSVLEKDCKEKPFEPVEIPEHLKAVWPDYVEMRKKIKKPMTPKAKKLGLSKLSELSSDNDIQIKIVEQSIFKAWSGFFPLNGNSNKHSEKKTNKIQADFLNILKEGDHE